MPHLSPMFWSMSPILFLFLLIILMSSFWWIHFPNFKTSSFYYSSKLNMWTWN